MTFVIKTTGAGGFIVAEYLCPLHGIFEVTVQRDANGDAPDTHPCMVIDELGVVADLDDHPDLTLCCAISPWTVSAPKPKVWTVKPTAAVSGGDMKDRPPHMLDTRPLAEGMKHSEWKKKQRELTRARRHAQLIEKGVLQKKIQVG